MELLRPDEVERMLRVSASTLRQWAVQGIGPPPKRIGPKMRRYLPSDVRDYIATLENEGAAT